MSSRNYAGARLSSPEQKQQQFGTRFKIQCADCGKLVGAMVPRGGDGLEHYTRKHFKPGTRERCENYQTYGGWQTDEHGIRYIDDSYLIDTKTGT
jgi:hypothetical protein